MAVDIREVSTGRVALLGVPILVVVMPLVVAFEAWAGVTLHSGRGHISTFRGVTAAWWVAVR